jgi:hypothetical protein
LAVGIIACFMKLRLVEWKVTQEFQVLATHRTLISPIADVGAIELFQKRMDSLQFSQLNVNDLFTTINQLQRCEQALEQGMISPTLRQQFEARINQNGEMLGDMQNRLVKNYDTILTHAQMRLSLVSSLSMRVALKTSMAGTLWLTNPRRSNMKCRCCTLVVSPKHAQTRL